MTDQVKERIREEEKEEREERAEPTRYQQPMWQKLLKNPQHQNRNVLNK